MLALGVPPAVGEGAAEGSGQREGGQGGVACAEKARVGRLPLRKAALEMLAAALERKCRQKPRSLSAACCCC